MNATENSMLYIPEAYAAPNPAALVTQHPFGTLITTTAAGIFATSTAMFFESDTNESSLTGHMARINPQAASFEAGQSVLAIFAGPHAYVSSSWYEAKPSVPTWNYVSAHVRGILEPIDDDAGQLEVLRLTARHLEAEAAEPWTLESAPPGKVAQLLPRIRSFRIRVVGIQGVTKLSQMQPVSDRLRVIRHLLDRGDGGSTDIARLMAHLQPLE
ncbi:MAG: FMN-binding negative transcriptional regulator [Gammaproteobacteria bacterium]